MAIVLGCIRKDSENFHTKIFIIKAPANFWKWNLPIFWNWPSKNTPDQQKRVAFRKSQKSAKSFHLIIMPPIPNFSIDLIFTKIFADFEKVYWRCVKRHKVITVEVFCSYPLGFTFFAEALVVYRQLFTVRSFLNYFMY